MKPLPTSTLILASAQISECEDWDDAMRELMINGPKKKTLFALCQAGTRMKTAIETSLTTSR